MVEIGFLDLLQGSAALTQMLSSAAWHMNNEKGDGSQSQVDYARYSVMATNSLRHTLSEPTKRVTVETVVAILTFAAYAVSLIARLIYRIAFVNFSIEFDK